MNYHKHSCKTAGLLVCLTLLVGCNSSGTVMPIATEVEVSNETQIPTKIGTPLPTYTREDLATSTPGVLSSPTSVPLSQSPGRIAFVSNRDGDYEIFSMEVDGSDLQQITDNDMHEVMPVWSPDGEKLAVTQYTPGDSENYYEASNIFVIDRISRDQTQLTFSPGFIPSFTNLEPKWSPDSSKILFMSTYEGMPDLYMVDADGDNIIRLTEEPSQVDMPSESFPSGKNWSPDGNKIVFFSTRDGDDRDIYIMQSDGSEIRRLTDHEASDTNPTWSPDGKRIAFTSERDDPEIPCFFECNTEIYLISPDGSDLKRLTAHPGQDRDPVWSPDGERVAFISNRDGNWEIYVIDVDGSNLSRITNSPANDWDPVWSPDGQRLAFVSARDGNAEIYVVDLDGNNLKRLTDHPADDLYPAWSPLPTYTSKPAPTPEITSSPSATSKIVPGVSSEEINELLLQANLLFYNAEYKGAIDVCNRILEIDQTNVEAYLLRADVHDNLGDPEAANADYLKVLELGEDSSLVLNNLCWNYAIMEQPEDALSFCKDALYKDYSPEILDSRGLVYALLDEYVYAIADFQNVLNALEDNNDPQSRYLYTTRLGWMEALIAGEDPFTPELLKELREGDHFLNGLDFHTHLMYEGAIKEFTLAIEHNQQLPDAYKFRGFAYNTLNKYEEAVGDLNKSVEMNPDSIELYLYRSWSYAGLGENQLALSDLDRVTELDQPQNYQSKVELLKAYLSYPIPVKVDDSEKTPIPLPAAVPLLDIAGDLPPVIEDEFGVTMVLVPAGEFTMGIDTDTAMEECNKILSSCGLDEFSDAEPPHIVYLDDYYIDLTEVTNSMYDECIGAGICRGQRDAASYTREDYALNPLYDDYPVIWVPWEYAETYCEWRGARLPTEAEWEKAARGTDERIYPWGNTLDRRKANFCGVGCIVKDYNDTLPVESNPGDMSPYGLLDMAGNVAEWVEDYYQDDYYSQSPMENPQGPEVGEYGHVVRGGAWSWSVGNLFTTYRNFTSANSSMSIGFRCVRTP